jgi:hypothetical protein
MIDVSPLAACAAALLKVFSGNTYVSGLGKEAALGSGSWRLGKLGMDYAFFRVCRVEVGSICSPPYTWRLE